MSRVKGPGNCETICAAEEASPKPVQPLIQERPPWPLETGPGAKGLRPSCSAYLQWDPGWVSFPNMGVSTLASKKCHEDKGGQYAEHLCMLASSSPQGQLHSLRGMKPLKVSPITSLCSALHFAGIFLWSIPSVSSLHRYRIRYRIRFRVVREMCFIQAEKRVRRDLSLGGNVGRGRC